MPAALTLSQFSRYVAQAISRQPVLLGAWVVAEISDMSLSGGHCYMTLLEKDASGATVARMRATIWAGKFHSLSARFFQATGQRLANGMKVMLFGGANYHINYGLTFNVGEINPSYTMGDLERIRREILMRLQGEGVIERNRRLKVEQPPLKVAVVSSPTAAGYGDFENQLHHNSLGVEFLTLLFPAAMQGERTPTSVMEALRLVEQTRTLVEWDCVVIIRGGGSTTDMTGFDNLELARRVATFPIPVVVGIGHERDRCVLDEIACVRCKTPTAAAAWLIDTVGAHWQRAADLAGRVATYASERMRGEHIRLQGLETMLPAAVESTLRGARLRLHAISSQLPVLAGSVTGREDIRLRNMASTLRMASGSLVERENARLRTQSDAMALSAASRIEREKTALANLENLIGVLSPESTLKRGYSITRKNGKSIRGPEDVADGDIIETATAGGILVSQVRKTDPKVTGK